ncbi:MAG: prephenate dehydratase domain-containing protein [Pyrinomonadaceae bacterium]
MSSSPSPRVAFQGEHGAFSEDAALKLLGPEIQLVPRRTFETLFRSLDEGLAEYVLVPIENSLIGAIKPAVDLLNQSCLDVVGEVAIPIRQLLIGCPGAVFEEIVTVESHPAALAQCKRFFAAHPGIERVETEDTAGSVARIIERRDFTRAAIAGRRAAQLYGGSILRENLEDRPENYTRFLLLAGPNRSNRKRAIKAQD